MDEIWKPVKGYEGYYEISNLGKVKSFCRNRERLMSLVKNSDGYLQIKLTKNGKRTSFRVHRLVAMHFVDNPQNLPEVNHKDFNRSNNAYTNLEWAEHIENVRYSSRQGHYKRFGERNSNYKNTTLKNFYAEHPEEKKKISRPGKQNGNAKPIRVYFENGCKDFSYIGECGDYLKQNGYIPLSTSINSIRSNISLSIKKQKPYHNLKFEYI